jgi:formylglycine-generating enzyme required for sulfatase activity
LAWSRTLTARSDATLDWWLARARLAERVAHDTAEVQTALDAAGRVAPNNPAVAEARGKLLAPPLTAAQFPERLSGLGFTAHADKRRGQNVGYILPPLVSVPAGPFLMGSDPKRDPIAAKESWTDREKPQHTVTLPAYEIARFPVTVAEYACYVRAGHAEPKDWQKQLGKLDHPVVNVTWHDTVAYAAWLSEWTGERWRLATEPEYSGTTACVVRHP